MFNGVKANILRLRMYTTEEKMNEACLSAINVFSKQLGDPKPLKHASVPKDVDEYLKTNFNEKTFIYVSLNFLLPYIISTITCDKFNLNSWNRFIEL